MYHQVKSSSCLQLLTNTVQYFSLSVCVESAVPCVSSGALVVEGNLWRIVTLQYTLQSNCYSTSETMALSHILSPSMSVCANLGLL